MIQIDVDKMIANDLTASQYLLLELLRTRKDNTIRTLLNKDKQYIQDIEILKSRQYILQMDKSGYIMNQKKLGALLDLEDSNFWELFSTYPMKVHQANETRVLRNANPDSKQAKVCLEKYKRVIKTEGQHRHVMACLELELKKRKKEKKLGFMQLLTTWLNQQSWELYEGMLEEVGSLNLDETEGYGHTLI